jgi:predicted nucleotidyltransferase
MIDEKYLPSVKALLTQKYHNDLVSLILFGSMLEHNKKSILRTDIDLIIVLKDTCSKKTRMQLQRELLGLQRQYEIYGSEFKDIFIAGLQSATGMFINSFICYYSDIKNKIFYKTFGVNRIFAFLLAPQSSVWISLKQRHRVLIGRDVIQEWNDLVLLNTPDIVRSYIMNSLLSLGALCLSVLRINMSRFSMEAIKWSLFTWRNRKQKPITQLQILCRNYSSTASKFEKLTLSAFLEYRKSMKPNKYLIIFAPLFIFKLHNRLREERIVGS